MFESAGMENPKIGTVIVGILTIVITLLTTYLLTRFGRKLLMQVSLGKIFPTEIQAFKLHYVHLSSFGTSEIFFEVGMLICCLVTGSILVSIGEEENRKMSIVAITFILIFVVFFQVGAGPIPPFITSDFFDANLR